MQQNDRHASRRRIKKTKKMKQVSDTSWKKWVDFLVGTDLSVRTMRVSQIIMDLYLENNKSIKQEHNSIKLKISTYHNHRKYANMIFLLGYDMSKLKNTQLKILLLQLNCKSNGLILIEQEENLDAYEN